MNYPQLYLRIAEQWLDRLVAGPLPHHINAKYERVLAKIAKRFWGTNVRNKR